MKSEHKDIHAITQDRDPGRQVPVSQGGQLQEQPAPVFAKLPPEQQQKLSDEMSATLYMLIDADKRSIGEVSTGTLEVIAAQGYSYKDGQLAKQGIPVSPKLTGFQKKAAETAEQYQKLPLQEKVEIIARAFGYVSGKIEISPCFGKWRGMSDVSIRFDTGVSLCIGNCRTAQAKTAKVQNELVNAVLTRYNPEIIAEAKEIALAALRKRAVKDNEIAVQKRLEPYILLNVEFNDGAVDESSGYIGWYYVTLAVDGRIRAHLETGLAHDIANGKVSEVPTRNYYFAAGGLKEADVDYVFNGVGFSSTSDLYTVSISERARKRAEKTLAEHEHTPPTAQ